MLETQATLSVCIGRNDLEVMGRRVRGNRCSLEGQTILLTAGGLPKVLSRCSALGHNPSTNTIFYGQFERRDAGGRERVKTNPGRDLGWGVKLRGPLSPNPQNRLTG